MLKKFQVKNFKNFQDELTWDLQAGSYKFNPEATQAGILKNTLIYGQNGTGKSNFTYALMDITTHLTDFDKIDHHYLNYLNLNSSEEYASFRYEFQFGQYSLIYTYKKTDMTRVFDETVEIDGELVISEDYFRNQRFVTLAGAETLNSEERELSLSFVKYIFNNTKLADTPVNQVFKQFRRFVEGMLYISAGTSEQNISQGLKAGEQKVIPQILASGNLPNLEAFLKRMGIDYDLEAGENAEGYPVIYVTFQNRKVNLLAVASHGTRVLIAYYFWMMELEKISFLVIDEFDAFYHNAVAEEILKEVRTSKVQSLFTSHNTSIMSNELLRPDSYFIIQGNQLKSLQHLTQKELRLAHNLEKMYNAGAFDEE